MLAAITAAHARGLGSSSSSARRKDHSASAIVSVRMTSGIRMRVNSHRPMQVAITSPA